MSDQDRLEVRGERVGGAGRRISGSIRDWRRGVCGRKKTKGKVGTGSEAIKELGIMARVSVKLRESAGKRSNLQACIRAQK